MALPQPGTLFESRYRLDSILGAGGFGTVYAATDTRSDRLVAVKILRPDFGGYAAKLRARFEREVQLVARLRDEHTVRLFDHGTSADGLMYMVTEYVEGEDLRELLARRGRLEPHEVVHILQQVLRALQEAHSHGLIHRDIKPANIRVHSYMGDDLRVKLLDFGVAKDTKSTEQLTSDGELVGTVRYMSPEQLTSAPLGPASDIYSLGLVAFELLLGADALHGQAVYEQLDRLRTGHIFSVPELERLGALPRVLDRMTSRDPGDRIQSATGVLAALDGSTPLAEVAPARVGPPPGSRRRRRVVGGVLVFIVVVALGLLVLAGDNEEAPRPRTPHVVANGSSLLATPPAAAEADTPSRRVIVRPAHDTGRSPARAAGCGVEPDFVGTSELRVRDGLELRSILAFVPETYDPDRPSALVVMLHENGESADEFLRYSHMERQAEQHGFIIIAPDGGFPFAWLDSASTAASVADAIDLAMKATCVDPARVFVVGHGNGGRAAEWVGAELDIAAIASTAHRDTVSERLPTADRVPPYLHIAPTRDKYNKVEGGNSCNGPEDYLSLAEQESRWRRRHGCTDSAPDWLRRGKHRCFTWTCDVAFVSCHLDGGRNWPGLPNRIWDDVSGQHCDGVPAKFPYAETIWNFFEEHASVAE